MMPRFSIRDAQDADYHTIDQILEAAFANHLHSDQTEHLIVQRLRQQDQLTVSLVAQLATSLVGYVAFSPVTVSGHSGRWYGLGPVAVSPDYQRVGVGRALIEQGLTLLRAKGADGCVVAGDPAYYCRFGFSHDPALFTPGIPADYFMSLSFGEAETPAGAVQYSPAFYR